MLRCVQADGESHSCRTSPSVIAAIAGPTAAAAMPVIICAVVTDREYSGHSKIAIEANAIVKAVAKRRSPAWRQVTSTKAPSGAVTDHAGQTTDCHDEADLRRRPVPRLQEYAEERPKPGLHIGHEEVQGVEREASDELKTLFYEVKGRSRSTD